VLKLEACFVSKSSPEPGCETELTEREERKKERKKERNPQQTTEKIEGLNCY
jgi:hypothetical protein